jgi:hypothetical protein
MLVNQDIIGCTIEDLYEIVDRGCQLIGIDQTNESNWDMEGIQWVNQPVLLNMNAKCL